jgi:hypothetical protein
MAPPSYWPPSELWRFRPRSAVLINRLKNAVGWFVVREKNIFLAKKTSWKK